MITVNLRGNQKCPVDQPGEQAGIVPGQVHPLNFSDKLIEITSKKQILLVIFIIAVVIVQIQGISGQKSADGKWLYLEFIKKMGHRQGGFIGTEFGKYEFV